MNKANMIEFTVDRLDNTNDRGDTVYTMHVFIWGANWHIVQVNSDRIQADFEYRGKGLRALAKKMKACGYASTL